MATSLLPSTLAIVLALYGAGAVNKEAFMEVETHSAGANGKSQVLVLAADQTDKISARDHLTVL